MNDTHSVPGSCHNHGDRSINSDMYILDLLWEGLQATVSHYSSQTRCPTEAILHVRKCGVARWKASNPLFPAATVAGVRARSYSFCVAKINLSLMNVERFSLNQFLQSVSQKYSPCRKKKGIEQKRAAHGGKERTAFTEPSIFSYRAWPTGKRRQSERVAPGLGPGPAGGVKER